MVEIGGRRVAAFPIVIVISLLMGSFVSFAEHPETHDGRAFWSKYEGYGGYMEVDYNDFDDDGYYEPLVFARITPGSWPEYCDNIAWESQTDIVLMDEYGVGNYFVGGCDWSQEVLVPLHKDAAGNLVDEYYECMIIVGQVDIDRWTEDEGGPGTYEWDSNVEIFVKDLVHDVYYEKRENIPTEGAYGFKIGCEDGDDGILLVLIAVSVVIGGSLIVAVIFYRKKSAATVAETSSQNQQKAYQPKEESREDVESPSKSEIENESIDGGVNSMFCPNCGSANDIHGKFCKDCGTNLSQ